MNAHNVIDLRARLAGSRNASPDLIELTGAIDEYAISLRTISRTIGFMSAGGRQPSIGTICAIEFVASRLLQAAEAYRLVNELGPRADVELPSDSERSE